MGTYFFFNGKLDRKNVLVGYAGRPAAAAGQNWLITGSDSRQGLTGQEEQVLATGHDISGHRSDTILILHIPASGRAVLVSIPRDSYVQIPGHGYNKINAAYAYGGPKLLAKTVQNATGLYINHFMGIGFGGLVNVVDAVGGVRMCLPGPMVDPKAGLDLKAGCQTLDGAQALGFVRTRNFAESDLQREQDQRLFLKALLSKMTSLGTLINPFAALRPRPGPPGRSPSTRAPACTTWSRWPSRCGTRRPRRCRSPMRATSRRPVTPCCGTPPRPRGCSTISRPTRPCPAAC